MTESARPPAAASVPASESARPRRRRLRGWLLNLVVLGAAFVVALLAAEVVVRLAAPQQLIQIRPDIWLPADTLGWVNRPNARTTINTGEGTVHLFTDADGFRVGSAGRAPGEARILLIGDSFMQALQVEYEQSLPALLSADLSRSLGKPVAVDNAGVDGWDPPQYYLRARSLLDTRPYNLLITAIYLGNDVVAHRQDYFPPRAPAERHRLRFPRRPTWPELVDAVLYPVNDFLEVRSHLFILMKRRLGPLLTKGGLSADYVPVGIRKSEAASPRWQVTAQLCADLAAAAARRGVPSLFVLIPTPFAIDTTAYAELRRGFGLSRDSVDIEQPGRLMKAALAARGLAVLDPLEDFQAAHARGVKLYGTVDRHLTPEGHAELARLVEPDAGSLLAHRRVAARP